MGPEVVLGGAGLRGGVPAVLPLLVTAAATVALALKKLAYSSLNARSRAFSASALLPRLSWMAEGSLSNSSPTCIIHCHASLSSVRCV